MPNMPLIRDKCTNTESHALNHLADLLFRRVSPPPPPELAHQNKFTLQGLKLHVHNESLKHNLVTAEML